MKIRRVSVGVMRRVGSNATTSSVGTSRRTQSFIRQNVVVTKGLVVQHIVYAYPIDARHIVTCRVSFPDDVTDVHVTVAVTFPVQHVVVAQCLIADFASRLSPTRRIFERL